MRLTQTTQRKDGIGTSLQRCFGPYRKRTPLPGEAAPQASDLWARPVYVPTLAASTRAGAMDAYAIPSRGLAA
jgi:predicted component of type VI protein secretion system